MRRFVSVGAAVLLALGPLTAWATSPSEEMTNQMQEWVDYKRPPFEPVELSVDGVQLTIFDATIEGHGLEEDSSIVKVIMRARRGEAPAKVTRAVLRGHDGTSYPMAYVKAPPAKILEEQGFKSYAFRLREVTQEDLKSLEITVASAKGEAEKTSTQLKLAMGEQIRFSDLDFASFAALPAFFMFFYYALTTSSAF
jgi:hypothetical protein